MLTPVALLADVVMGVDTLMSGRKFCSFLSLNFGVIIPPTFPNEPPMLKFSGRMLSCAVFSAENWYGGYGLGNVEYMFPPDGSPDGRG